MKILSVALLLALASCIHHEAARPVTMRVEPSANEYAVHISNGVVAWNVWLESAPLQVKEAGSEWTIQAGDLPMGLWGTTDRQAKRVTIFPGLDQENAAHVTIHELGHVIGLGHLPENVEGVMNASSATSTLSRGDIAMCQRKGICRTDRPLPDPPASLVEKRPVRCPLQEQE